MSRSRIASLPVWILAAFAVVAALKLASAILAPILLALVMGVVLSPVTRRIDRLGAPRALSAFLALFASILFLLALFVLLEPLLSNAIRRAPIIWEELREIVSNIRYALRGLDQVSAEVATALNDSPQAATGTGDAAEEEIALPSITDALFLAPGFAAAVMIFVGTLYFFLLARREVYDWISSSPSFPLTTSDMLEAEREVSRYFLTITVINGCFGLLVTGVMLLLGMPYAPLWGFVAFLVNFILYLGPAVFALALLLGGLIAFEGPMSFAPAAAYLLMNMTEGQFVTPALVGRQMSVNPLMVFLSLVCWLWLWGPIGGVIAIPLLVWGMVLFKRGRAAQTTSSGTPGKLRPNRLAGAKG
ncbi:AI-2E family transporter [Rhodophyticola porphyridii]|uniref:AI-2E family transporter n=1 Tax=Rhodophyticola porphyridii TaxID=1852017 RepID=A0A3L9Y2P3_9RHOB|nr:AI-2E family transporter [Rhodophyticola porphyridii]RMA43081.1 AI-2E family transporter [Rhodophyticola porphyridii]